MEKEWRIFGRLLDFWQEGAPQDGLSGGIGFWRRLRRLTGTTTAEPERGNLRAALWDAENSAATTDALAQESAFWQKKAQTTMAAIGGRLFLHKEEAEEPMAIQSAAGKMEKRLRQAKKWSTGVPMLPKGAAVAEKIEEGRSEQVNGKGLFSAAFWERRKAERQAGLRTMPILREEPLTDAGEKKRIPLGEEQMKKAAETPAAQEMTAMERQERMIPAEKAADTIDIDALMHQFAQRLWEEREGASRKRYR